jgi:lipopolysaccharide/colanic/teichoic acid biosynthesis glycosyltransferase
MEPDTRASHNASAGGPDRVAPMDDRPAMSMSAPIGFEGAARGAESGMLAAPGLAPAPAHPASPTNGHAHGAVAGRAPGQAGHANGHAGWNGMMLQGANGSSYAATIPALDTRGTTLYLRGGKRVLDVIGALVGLVLSAPLLAVAAILVKLETHGPVLYKSRRVGRGGRPFTFFKLRSMVNNADLHRDQLSHLNETDGPVFKIARDPRVTRVGRFLRTTSIDEIPQLLNVLRGDMSLVGPRPPIAEEVAQYEPWQYRRLEVRPGLTCLWQISGRSRIGFQEWMRLDLEYIRQQSFWLDVKILIRTIPAVLSREGAY